MGAIMHLLNMVMPPSKSSGGMNRLVCWLAEEQARQGHKVYVGSPEGESTEYFEHISLSKNSTLEDLQAKMPTDVTDVEMHEMPQDVTRWVYDNYPRSFSVIHGGLRPESQPEGGWSGAKAVFVSRSHMELAGGSQFAYNGVPVDEYDFSETKDDYLLFLAKVKRSKKGVQTAIRVAKRCKRKLIVAGGVRRGSPATWFPWHPLIRPIGYVDGARKREVLSKASALLVPIRWEEPFGLTVVEAMLSGTPVIAFRRGAMPELVVDGVTGFLCDTEDEMVEAVGKVSEIAPEDCRRHVMTKFSATAMYQRHQELLELAGSGTVW
jgi:glycosyltransferase involved in cell wall biosynthesis